MKAATLAVGTEVVDGQITDRNSAWISAKLVLAGVEVIEHRAVADDRIAIAKALRELSSEVELLFVTGGLGPTSDDFTRELISEVFHAPLEFDDASWTHIEKRFEARGLQAKPIQRQQCFFPSGATILENPAGTANAFWLHVTDLPLNECEVIALPGPPVEIAAVWEKHLASKIESMIPVEEREELFMWRTLGAGESEIAERIEEVLKGTGLRVGYRAHLPYVEVKLWMKRANVGRAEASSAEANTILKKIEIALAPWLVSRGKEDLADAILRTAAEGVKTYIRDSASGGQLQARLFERAKELKLEADLSTNASLRVETELFASAVAAAAASVPTSVLGASDGLFIELSAHEASKQWRLTVKKSTDLLLELEVAPTPLYSFGTERGRRYLTERVFHALQQALKRSL